MELDIYCSELKRGYDFLLCKQDHKSTSWFGSTHLIPVNQTHFDPSVSWTFLSGWTSTLFGET